ncbi:putative methyltransferase PMT15 [Hibiscus syriacus]|uniref:Methyltransferase n=1 Tax=Hibiscus syriacus TaxID=106335 RepID=A0A6A3AXE9_HIBSY|nr:putative methyltransferase PMT15 [Hibiscus syriacus]
MTKGGQLPKWIERLNAIPPRISRGSVTGITENVFVENTELWKKRAEHYKKIDHQLAETGRTVPVEDDQINTLGVIYERGLIGTYQNWCEPMSTYPRTCDFIHVDSVFSLYNDRCETEDIHLEMDRILRPEGRVIIRDDVDLLLKIKKITDAKQWEGRIVDHEKEPHEREKILFAVKQSWTAPPPLTPEQDQ